MSAKAFDGIVVRERNPSLVHPGLIPVVYRDAVTANPPGEHELKEILQWVQWNGPATSSTRATSLAPSRSSSSTLDDDDDSMSDISPLSSPIIFPAYSPAAFAPSTLRELEQSRPPTRRRKETFDGPVVQSATFPAMNRWRLASAAVFYFMMGMAAAATGALLPYIEIEYDIGYAVVSVIFVTQAFGFISMALFAQTIDGRLGRARAYMISASFISISFIAMATAPPFPVVVISYYFYGLGVALFLAMTNAFIVNLVNGTFLLSFMMGIYGIGGVISPIIATAVVSNGVRWSFYYFIPLAMSMTCVVFMGWAYKDFEKDNDLRLLTSYERKKSRQMSVAAAQSKAKLLKRAIKSRTTLLGALFIFFYQGGEVTISGWVISFLINYRSGDPSEVGNVTSGFWGGITLGRFVLTPLAQKFGEKRSIFVLVGIAAGLQLTVWFVPNIIGNAVAVSLLGFFLGPIYPCAMAVVSKLLPRSIQISALSVVTSMGASGGALVPFCTGLMSQKLGIVVLHPILLFAFTCMVICWKFLPRTGRATVR